MTDFSHPDFELTYAPQDEAARVAADVAARYGVGVSAGVTLARAPRGARATFVYPVYDGRHLVYPNGAEAFRESMRPTPGDLAAKRAEALRARVVAAHHRQMTAPEIAVEVGCSVPTVYDHLKIAGLSPLSPQESRRLRLRSLVSAGHDARSICGQLGLSALWVIQTAREMGLTLRGVEDIRAEARAQKNGSAPRRSRRTYSMSGEVAARRARILQMIQARPRPTIMQIAAQLGVTRGLVADDLSHIYRARPDLRIGAVASSQVGQSMADRRAGMEARRARMRQMLQDDPGLGNAALAACLGVARSVISKDRASMGLSPVSTPKGDAA